MSKIRKNYHWVIMICCCLFISSSIGLCANATGIFYTPVSNALNVGRGTFALHTTLSGIAAGIFSPFIVRLFRRFNAKILTTIGVILTSITTMLMAFSFDVTHFYILGIVRGISYSLFSMVPVNLLLNNWFEKKQGLVLGIVFSFSGIGGAIFNSVLSRTIESMGWEKTYLIVAALVLVLTLPASLLVVYTPDKMKLLPYGRVAPGNPKEYSSHLLTAKRSIFTPLFFIVCAFVLFGTFITGMGQFLPSFAEEIGASLSFGATMLSFAMIGNIIFKFVIGVLSDKFGPIIASSIIIGMNSIALAIMAFTKPTGEAYYLLAASLLYGTIYSIGAVGIPLVTRFAFGAENYGIAYGYISMIMNLGGAISFTIIGFTYDMFLTYKFAMIGCMVLGIINIVLLQIIRIRKGVEDKNFREKVVVPE